MCETEERALSILDSYGDAPCYAQMTQALTRGKAKVLAAQEDGVLLRHAREGFYMLAGTPEGMRSLAALIPQDASDVLLHGCLEAEYVEEMRERLHMADAHPYVMYGYYGELPPEEENVLIRMLGISDLDFVYENYGHASREYLGMLLADGVMIGAEVDGQLAGFIGEHAAGAMGLLHVIPEYRRHHLGFALEQADIRSTMLRGCTPFCQVDPANAASHRLQERLGMTRSKGLLYWMSAQAE